MNRYVISAVAVCAALVCFAVTGPDVSAGSGEYGCAGVPVLAEDYGYGCHEAAVTAGCAGERSILAGRRPVRRLVGAVLRGTGRVAAAPFRVLQRARFAPQRRFGGGCG